jgi:hypothetical protein
VLSIELCDEFEPGVGSSIDVGVELDDLVAQILRVNLLCECVGHVVNSVCKRANSITQTRYEYCIYIQFFPNK